MKSYSPHALFQRTTLLLGRPAMEQMARRRVIIFGLGGVGSWCAEALVRTGFAHLTLVDSDTICVTNVNRQVQATAHNVGAVKAEELRKRLLEINPHANITALRTAYDEQTQSQFDLAQYDYAVDAIDSLKNKVLLIEHCARSGVKFYCSMGAAARLDPTQIRTSTLDQIQGCRLARVVRQELRRRKVPLTSVTCVHSLEPALEPVGRAACGTSACLCVPEKPGQENEFPDWCSTKARINGAVVHVTAIFGLTLAGLIIRDLLANLPPPEEVPTEAPIMLTAGHGTQK